AGSFSLRLLMLGLSTTSLFISRESLLLWWRARSRGQKQDAARRSALVYLGLAALFGAPLVLVYHLYLLIVVGVATVALLLVNARQAVRREDRTTGGEILAILGLTLTAPAAYYVSRGAWESKALLLWGLCALYFASSVFYIKLRVYAVNPRKEEARLQA